MTVSLMILQNIIFPNSGKGLGLFGLKCSVGLGDSHFCQRLSRVWDKHRHRPTQDQDSSPYLDSKELGKLRTSSLNLDLPSCPRLYLRKIIRE